MTDLEFRNIAFDDLDLDLREEGDEWTVSGIGAPYGQTVTIGGKYQESFQRGAFEYDDIVALFVNHDHQAGGLPIGRITHLEEREEGLYFKATISKTAKGTEVRQLIKDKVFRFLSVGFQPKEQRNENGVVVRTKALLKEISVVLSPAYSGALIEAVRSTDQSSASAEDSTEKKGSTMTDTIAADVSEVRSSLEDLSRQVSLLQTRGTEESAPVSKFNSMGDFIKRGLAQGEATKEDIGLLVRAFAGGASAGDTVSDAAPGFAPTWVDNDIHVMQQKRNVLELFTKKPMPAQGMSFSYPSAITVTGDVAKQTNEADNLTVIKVALSNATASVSTYGAYSDLSRQVIEREPVSYLNEVLDAQKQSYAKVTNSAVRTFLTGGSGYNTVSVAALASQTSAKAWVDAVLAGTDAIANNSTLGLTADVWVVSSAVFAKIASVYDSTGRPVFVVNGDGVNTVGGVNVIGQTANIAGLPVIVDRALTGNVTYMASSRAINVYEDGSKFLQDQNIINLTQQFTIYGYLALALKDAKGVTAVTVPTA